MLVSLQTSSKSHGLKPSFKKLSFSPWSIRISGKLHPFLISGNDNEKVRKLFQLNLITKSKLPKTF